MEIIKTSYDFQNGRQSTSTGYNFEFEFIMN
jgi:hypothetical protein